MKTVLRMVAVGVFAVVACATAQAQSDPLVGTWKLNVAKSKFDPGPGPKSLTRTVVAEGKSVKYTFEGIGADGKPVSFGFSITFDGKDNPTNGSLQGVDTISAKRTDAHHFVATLKSGGKEIEIARVSVSADGKVTTVESTGTTMAGTKAHNVQVFDKQ